MVLSDSVRDGLIQILSCGADEQYVAGVKFGRLGLLFGISNVGQKTDDWKKKLRPGVGITVSTRQGLYFDAP